MKKIYVKPERLVQIITSTNLMQNASMTVYRDEETLETDKQYSRFFDAFESGEEDF